MSSRRAGQRLGWAVTDQLLSSFSNVLAAVMVARAVSADEFGYYAGVIAVFGLVVGVARATIAQPLLIASANSTSDEHQRIAGEAAATAATFGTLCALAAIAVAPFLQSPVGMMLLILALAIPLVVAQDVLRSYFVLAQRPRAAALNDGLWFCCLAAAVIISVVTSWRFTATTGIIVWAATGAFTGLVAMGQAGIRRPVLFRMRSLISWDRQHRLLWPGSLVDFLASSIPGYVALGFAAAGGGARDVAALRAVTLLVFGPWSVAAIALTTFLVPELVRRDDVRTTRRAITAAALGLAGLSGVVLVAVALVPSRWGYRILGETWDGLTGATAPMAAFLALYGVQVAVSVALRSRRMTASVGRIAVIGAIVNSCGVIIGHFLSPDVTGLLWGLAAAQLLVIVFIFGRFGGDFWVPSRRSSLTPSWIAQPRPSTRVTEEQAATAVFVAACFPFFRLIPIGASEIQPWAAVLAGVLLLKIGVHRVAYRALTPLALLLTTALAVSTLLPAQPQGRVASILGFAVAAAPLVVVALLVGRLGRIHPRAVEITLAAHVALGMLQQVTPSVLRIGGIDKVVQLVLPRYNPGFYLGAGRGVTMFAPEPAYAATTILLLAFMVWRLALTGQRRGGRLAVLVLALALASALNRSGTLAVYLVIMLLAALAAPTWRMVRARAKALAVVVPLMLLAATLVAAAPNSSPRPLLLTRDMIRVVVDGPGALVTPDTRTRLTHVAIGYQGITRNVGFGGGLGSATRLTLAEIRKLPDADQIVASGAVKPFAYASLMSLELGLLGAGTSAWAVLCLAKKRGQRWTSRAAPFRHACLACACLGIFGLAPVSLPAYWIILAMAADPPGRCQTQPTPTLRSLRESHPV
jgi:O-antigen/teichoic acid export membrane protein